LGYSAFFDGIAVEVELVDFFKGTSRGPLASKGFVDLVYKIVPFGWEGLVDGLEGCFEVYMRSRSFRGGKYSSLGGVSIVNWYENWIPRRR